MKSFAATCLLLSSLFLGSLYNADHMDHFSHRLSFEIQTSQEAARQGNWALASKTLGHAKSLWDAQETYLHIIISHNELDESEVLFSEIREYAAHRECSRYCSSAERLRAQLSHLSETQQLKLGNIL